MDEATSSRCDFCRLAGGGNSFRGGVEGGQEGERSPRTLEGAARASAGGAAATRPLVQPSLSACWLRCHHGTLPRPRSRGPGRPFGPWPAGWAWAQPRQPPGITPRPRPPGPPGPPEPPPGWQPPGWTSALTRVPVHSRVCDAHKGHGGAESVPLKFCPNAMVASHPLVHIPWRSSQGLGWAGSSPLIPEIVGVTVTPSHPHALARQAHRDDPDRSNPGPGAPHSEPCPRGAGQEPRGPQGSHSLSSAQGCRERPSVPWRPWSLIGPDGAA